VTTFYKKVGKRYVAVSEYSAELIDSFSNGAHLVIVGPGSKFITYKIDENLAGLIAAGRYAKDVMVNAIMTASEARPSRIPLNQNQKQLWDELKTSFNDENFGMYYSNATHIADEGISALVKEADKMLQNPAVKKAYEQFLLVYKLTKDESS